MKSDSVVPSLENLKDVSRVILLDNQKLIQKMQKKVDKVVADKVEEISRLKNHSRSLTPKIKKLKSLRKSQQLSINVEATYTQGITN